MTARNTPATRVRAVYFDIGETVLDRSREYAALARELGVTPHTFSAVFGAVVAQGGNVADLPARFGRPDWTGASGPALIETDLYPDVRTSLTRLKRAGLRIGIAGNQPPGMTARLRALDLGVDTIATSADWGVAKPDPKFFAKLVESAAVAPAEIVYVGDQLENDVLASMAAGLQSVRILRGPWGILVRDAAIEGNCLAVVESLTDLTELLVAGQELPDQTRAGDVGADEPSGGPFVIERAV